MNVCQRRSWLLLPEKEKEVVIATLRKEMEKQYQEQLDAYANVAEQKNEEIVIEAQKIWLKMACFVLHDSFGWSEEKLNEFLASWKSMYRWNKRLGSAEKQKEVFAKCIEECFPKNGYPENIIELLEKQ